LESADLQYLSTKKVLPDHTKKQAMRLVFFLGNRRSKKLLLRFN